MASERARLRLAAPTCLTYDRPCHSMLTIIKTVGGPGSTGLFLLLMGLGAAVRRLSPVAWLRRAATAGMLAVGAAYVVMALPLTANALLDRLPQPAVHTDHELDQTTTLFIFDGDNRQGRAIASAALAARGHLTEAWLLGADYMIDELVLAGFPPRILREDSSATNTLEQVALVQRVMARRGGRAAIVASRLSIPRIVDFLRDAKVDALLIGAPLDDEPVRRGLWGLVPTRGALVASRDAIYEHAALWYYGR